MIFLIEYNRAKGQLVSLRSFESSRRGNVEVIRFNRELELNREGLEHEVVLLEAENEDAVRRTHRRYFEDLRGLLTIAPGA